MGRENFVVSEHLDDLRKVFIVCLISVLITAVVSYLALGNLLLAIVTSPLENLHVNLVYIGMAEAFITKIKLAVLGGLVMSSPVILWQLWCFIRPGLYPRERRILLIFIPAALFLFALGAAFAYFVVFKFATRFLLVVVSEGLTPMLSIGKYVSFLITFIIPFGLAFQLPLAVYFLAKMGWMDHTWLIHKRSYALLFAFVIGAVLTPPDVISQLLLAGPMIVLYEFSILIARFVRKQK